MSKHTFSIIVIVCVLAIVAVGWFLPTGPAKTDAERYERWRQSTQLLMAIWGERHLSKGVARFFRLSALEQKYLHEHERLRDVLVASGYLTNFTVVVASGPTDGERRGQVFAKLQKAFRGKECEWEGGFYGDTSAITVTCRPEYEALCRQALNE